MSRALSAAILSSAAAGLLMLATYTRRAAWSLDMDRSLPRVLDGFYPVERNASGTSFAWTGPRASIALDGLDRRVPWTLSLHVLVWRPAGVALPEVHLTVDGVERLVRTVTQDGERIDLVVPPQPSQRGALVGLRVVPTFRPTSPDSRELGVAVDRVALAPAGRLVLPPLHTLAGSAVAGALVGAAFVTAGISVGAAVAATLPLAAAQAWLASRHLAPYLDYAAHATWLAAWTALALVLSVWVVERWRGRGLDPMERFVALASAAAFDLRMLVLLHPDMPVGDALFHAHRFEDVLAGRFYFTSLAPGHYAFPYPIALYAVAAPFSLVARTPAEHIVLLRAIVTAADVLVGVLVYAMVVRAWRDRLAGAVALVTYELLPLGARTLEWGNLTNMFGQALFVATTAVLASPRLGVDGWKRTGALAALMASAFLAHPSTFGILAGLAGGSWLLFRYRRGAGRAERRAARATLAAATAAGLIAVAVYYAHFLSTYRAAALRIGAELGQAAGAQRWDRLWMRVTEVPGRLGAHYGWPALCIATVGLARLRSMDPTDRLRLVLAAWIASCAGFFVLGLLTPIDLRYYLALLPVVAMLAGLGASHAWRVHPRWRAALVALGVWMLWIGVHVRVGALE